MYRILVILSVFVAACSHMLLKQGTINQSNSFWKHYINSWVIGGYTLMFLSLLVNIYAMSKGILAKEVCILETLSFLFIPILSFICFREKLSLQKIISIGVIIIGMIIFFL